MDKIKVRRGEILKLLETAPMIPVSELASLLGVTKETVRKDLAALEEQGLAVWRHGGAALTERSAAPIPYALRESFHKEGKGRIAKAACALIQEEDSILLESSTTTMALCQALLERPGLLSTLTVMTNSLYIAQLFEMGSLVKRFFLLGGWLTASEGATQGPYTYKTLREFHPDKAFLSGAALNEEMELTGYYESDICFQQEAIRCAKSTILLLDKAKYPSTGLFSAGGLSRVAYVVTDAVLPEEGQERLRKQNVTLIFVK